MTPRGALPSPRYRLALDLRSYWEDQSLAVVQIVNVGNVTLTNYKGTLSFYKTQAGDADETRDVMLPVFEPGDRASFMIEPECWEQITLKGTDSNGTLPDSSVLAAAIWAGYQSSELLHDSRLERAYLAARKLTEAIDRAAEPDQTTQHLLAKLGKDLANIGNALDDGFVVETTEEFSAPIPVRVERSPWWRRMVGK